MTPHERQPLPRDPLELQVARPIQLALELATNPDVQLPASWGDYRQRIMFPNIKSMVDKRLTQLVNVPKEDQARCIRDFELTEEEYDTISHQVLILLENQPDVAGYPAATTIDGKQAVIIAPETAALLAHTMIFPHETIFHTIDQAEPMVPVKNQSAKETRYKKRQMLGYVALLQSYERQLVGTLAWGDQDSRQQAKAIFENIAELIPKEVGIGKLITGVLTSQLVMGKHVNLQWFAQMHKATEITNDIWYDQVQNDVRRSLDIASAVEVNVDKVNARFGYKPAVSIETAVNSFDKEMITLDSALKKRNQVELDIEYTPNQIPDLDAIEWYEGKVHFARDTSTVVVWINLGVEVEGQQKVIEYWCVADNSGLEVILQAVDKHRLSLVAATNLVHITSRVLAYVVNKLPIETTKPGQQIFTHKQQQIPGVPRKLLKSQPDMLTEVMENRPAYHQKVVIQPGIFNELDNSIRTDLASQVNTMVKRGLVNVRVRSIRSTILVGPNGGNVLSLGLSNGYRALAEKNNGEIVVFSILSHAEYDKVLKR